MVLPPNCADSFDCCIVLRWCVLPLVSVAALLGQVASLTGSELK